jgi:hypothetical protein
MDTLVLLICVAAKLGEALQGFRTAELVMLNQKGINGKRKRRNKKQKTRNEKR